MDKIKWFCNERGHCTCFVDSIFGMYFGDCCKLHDKRYENKRLTRLQADILLYRCVKRKANIAIASFMFVGIRLGGWYFYKR